MSDSGQSLPQQQSRSTSVTKSSRTTHQRKPSLNISTGLYAIPEKNIPVTSAAAPSGPIPTSSVTSSSLLAATAAGVSVTGGNSSSSASTGYPSSPKRAGSRSITNSWRKHLKQIMARFESSSGPLLPHDKAAQAFGGTAKHKRSWLSGLPAPVRFVLFFYIIFSVFLSVNHMWKWFSTSAPVLDERFGEQWRPERTYDADQSYSLVDDMTHGLKMSKLFSKSYYEAVKTAQPFWLKGAQAPSTGDITLITTVTPGTWNELERMAEHWHGPISVILQAGGQDDAKLMDIKSAYANHRELPLRTDVHLVQFVGPSVSVLLPRNAERNMARLLARTDYVCEMPSNLVPATDVRRTFDTNRNIFEALLKEGDMLVVPTFGFSDTNRSKFTIPYHKSRLLELVDEQEVGLVDPHWDMNDGPTNLVRWRDATTLYPIESYHHDYEPIVIESKLNQPWCPERFLDRRSACFLVSYLAGGEFWVLPDDFAIRLPENKEYIMPDIDHVVENRLYAKFIWEQCVHHARQLDSLKLWKGPRSEHVRKQCSRVIQTWGKGLIGKPE